MTGRGSLWRLQISEAEPCYGHYLLLRRNRDEKQERVYYIVYAREDQADLNMLVQVAGHRWEIERGMRSGSLRSATMEKLVSAYYAVVIDSFSSGY